jgi:hypothetical protein
LGKFAIVINTDGDKTPANLKESKRIYRESSGDSKSSGITPLL